MYISGCSLNFFSTQRKMLKKFVKMLRLIKKSAYVIYEWPLSDACTKSGLSAWIVQKMMILVGLPPLVICIIVVLSTVALTQVHVIKAIFYIY